MSYTRLSMNFQPKTARHPRRRFLSASLAAWASCHSLTMVPALAASNPPDAGAAPPMTHAITDENDTSFTLQTLRGRPLLINFWASWCAPCIAEMPSLQKAAEKLRPDGIDMLLISVDRGGRQKALPFLQDRGITRPLMGFDPKAALSREMGVRGLPTSFLLSADQSQSWTYVGPREWDSALMIAEIRNLLRLAKASPAPSRQNNQNHLLV